MYSIAKIKRLAGPLFLEAVTLPDYADENPRCRGGEQFRYLAWRGDALLHLVVTEHILSENGFSSDSKEAPKQLSERRQRLEGTPALSYVGQKLGLDRVIRGTAPRCNGWSSTKRTLAEVTEALIAAVYQNSGNKAMMQFVAENIIEPLAEAWSIVDELSSEPVTTEPESKAPSAKGKVPRASNVGWPAVKIIQSSLGKGKLKTRLNKIEQSGRPKDDRLNEMKAVLLEAGFLAP